MWTFKHMIKFITSICSHLPRAYISVYALHITQWRDLRIYIRYTRHWYDINHIYCFIVIILIINILSIFCFSYEIPVLIIELNWIYFQFSFTILLQFPIHIFIAISLFPSLLLLVTFFSKRLSFDSLHIFFIS